MYNGLRFYFVICFLACLLLLLIPSSSSPSPPCRSCGNPAPTQTSEKTVGGSSFPLVPDESRYNANLAVVSYRVVPFFVSLPYTAVFTAFLPPCFLQVPVSEPHRRLERFQAGALWPQHTASILPGSQVISPP